MSMLQRQEPGGRFSARLDDAPSTGPRFKPWSFAIAATPEEGKRNSFPSVLGNRESSWGKGDSACGGRENEVRKSGS